MGDVPMVGGMGNKVGVSDAVQDLLIFTYVLYPSTLNSVEAITSQLKEAGGADGDVVIVHTTGAAAELSLTKPRGFSSADSRCFHFFPRAPTSYICTSPLLSVAAPSRFLINMRALSSRTCRLYLPLGGVSDASRSDDRRY